MEKDGACKMDRQNKICSCARKSGGRKNNAEINKEVNHRIAMAKEAFNKKEKNSLRTLGKNYGRS